MQEEQNNFETSTHCQGLNLYFKGRTATLVG